jgi:hypothetical protein
MQEQYIEPGLKLVGGADEVVLGSSGIGFDFIGERLPHSMEFETDDSPAIPSR